MKKILFVAAMLFMASTVIISCKKDDATSTSIVGKWEASSFHTSTIIDSSISTTPVVEDSTYTHGKAPIITFNADGTYTAVDAYADPATTESGTYTAANGKVTTIPTSGSGDLEITNANYSISGNTMTVTESEGGFGGSVSAKLVLTRQ